MSAADLEWKIIYFEEIEPADPINSLPFDGWHSCLKILVPHAAIKKYTAKQKTADGKTATMLENPRSHILCTILMFYTDPEPGHWAPLQRYEAQWDGLPAKNGYYTFYGTDLVTPLWPGVQYYHNLEFYDADGGEYVEDVSYYSDIFHLSHLTDDER
ncbi:hypothetical protein F4801DRAFT_600198 [Xylaria longipes]|nr:hypothetical protein F4801DRAFT_600198 [Xylaria longipes]RYC65137.1 hypothetical protein CHU98_g1119 [Xylaria longipes]